MEHPFFKAGGFRHTAPDISAAVNRVFPWVDSV